MRRKILLLLLLLFAAALAIGGIKRHTSRYDFMISQAAARNNIDFFLVKSLIYEESWFRSNVRGPHGEFGLMQITKAAASDFAAQKGFPPYQEEQLLEPALNLEIGCWYLQQSLHRYRNSPQPTLYALLRYNAGESRADTWLKRALSHPPQDAVSNESHYLSMVDFPTTRAYARHILKRSRNHNFWF